MTKREKQPSSGGIKRSILEWLGIGAVIGILYFTGLHTQVLGALQRAMLWTGFFDAERTEVKTAEGPFLTQDDYAFSFVNSKGGEYDLKDFEGEVIFINVWASWCPPCVAEMPTIETLYKKISDHDQINFILLSLDQDPKKATRFMEDREFGLPYHFPASPVPVIFNSGYLPTTYVVSKQGQVVYKQEGIADYSSPDYSNWLIELANR